MTRVAVTRAAPEASATAERIRAMGGEPVLAPLLSIERVVFDTSCAGAQAVLFTSANGVRAFAAATPARSITTLTVGDATAEAARSAGFADVRSAGGDVSALEALARAALDPGGGKVLHISGAHAAGDLAGALTRAGFNAERRIAYRAQAADTLPPAFNSLLDVVLFHSARAAETFIALGAPGAGDLTAACLSPAVAKSASKTNWGRLVVAPRPRESDLLAAALAV